jgi:hypothetical protein
MIVDGDELRELGADGWLGEDLIAFASHFHLGFLRVVESGFGHFLGDTLDDIVMAVKDQYSDEFGND